MSTFVMSNALYLILDMVYPHSTYSSTSGNDYIYEKLPTYKYQVEYLSGDYRLDKRKGIGSESGFERNVYD